MSVFGSNVHPHPWRVSSPSVRRLELIDGCVKVLTEWENERFTSCTYLVDVHVATPFLLETLGQDTYKPFHIILPTSHIILCSIVGRMQCVALNRVFVIWRV